VKYLPWIIFVALLAAPALWFWRMTPRKAAKAAFGDLQLKPDCSGVWRK
jgi:hypothetical protein